MQSDNQLIERNTATMNKFYNAFVESDPTTMSSLYSPSATFSDPAFCNLKGKEPSAMWHMLLSKKQAPAPPGAPPNRTFAIVSATRTTGVVKWEARYQAPGTGRNVHNVITTTMTFDDAGLIVKQEDVFDLHKWCGMALGCIGSLLGGTACFQNYVRSKARGGLDKFIAKRAEFQGGN